MNLLRDVSLLRLWRRLAADRRRAAPPVYRITVPAPLADTGLPAQRHPVVVAQPVPLPRAANG
ncbi:MAG TPA: hypothetical protein VFH59_02810 [Frateuria sp.]|uniref:hypothetical protein n=1 Tax=Frateuria sp. TaxID=2211372 RepID=UPI002D7F7DE5|nr:hypothetical protein [Frateuria sp.]HET6804359.1 hypothetical protein [Frateuria sp.]